MRATIYLIIATCLWGLNYHFAKLVLPEVHFLEGALWRYGLAVAVLTLVNLYKLPSISSVRSNIKGILFVGAIGLFGFNIFFFIGMQHTTGVNGALIMGLNPAVTIILSALILKTYIKPNHILGLLIAIVGVFYLLLKGDLAQLLTLQFGKGDLLVLVAVVFFALHHVWVKKYSSETLTNQQFTFLTAIACFICLVAGAPAIELAPVTAHTKTFWIGAIGIGCLGTGLSYLFWNKGVKEAGAHRAGIFVNLTPLSAGLSASFFEEKLYSYHIVSGIVIIIGLLIMQFDLPKIKSFNTTRN